MGDVCIRRSACAADPLWAPVGQYLHGDTSHRQVKVKAL